MLARGSFKSGRLVTKEAVLQVEEKAWIQITMTTDRDCVRLRDDFQSSMRCKCDAKQLEIARNQEQKRAGGRAFLIKDFRHCTWLPNYFYMHQRYN